MARANEIVAWLRVYRVRVIFGLGPLSFTSLTDIL
jgi:hypothetical protein